MQLVLSWPVRVVVLALLVFSLFVDFGGYIYRIQNHYPLTGYAPDMPPSFNGWQDYIHRGLDIQGGTHLELQLTGLPKNANAADIQKRTIAVLDHRVNALGVSEPYIAAVGNDRIVVDLAGVSADKAQAVLGRTAKLVTTTWVKDDAPNAAANTGPYPGYKPKISGLTGDMVTGASSGLDQNGLQYAVNITLNSDGANIFGQLTSAAVAACSADCPERHIAHWLDLTEEDIAHWDDAGYAARMSAKTESGGKLLTDPYVQTAIPGGQVQITGQFDAATAKDLATLLNSGALPATITVLQSFDVGASLGADSVRKSFLAGLLGLLVVVVFMIAFYRVPGLLASVALLFYAGLVLALFKTIPVVVTLAGMAGFVLSVGMAVDANVLIFERFKEEMRSGRTVGAAVDAAVRRAWPAIRDSNISTAITSGILAFVGSGAVRGFAVTLLLGVAVSMLSSIIVTHNLLAIVLTWGWARRREALGVTGV